MTIQAAGEPQERALAAAEALDAEGLRVTARAVKDRARVQMETARAAAADWNNRKAGQATVPAPPESLTVRYLAFWGEAYRVARVEFDAEREGWLARLEDAEREADALQADVETAERDRDQARADLERRTASEEQLRQQHVELEKTQIRLQANLEAAAAERDQMRVDLAGERERHAEAEARHHEVRLELAAAAREVDTLRADVETAERDRDQARADLERRTASEEQLRQQHVELEKTQIRLQASLEAAAAERDQLRVDLAGERERHAEAEARHHQAMLDLVNSERDPARVSPPAAPGGEQRGPQGERQRKR